MHWRTQRGGGFYPGAYPGGSGPPPKKFEPQREHGMPMVLPHSQNIGFREALIYSLITNVPLELRKSTKP